MCSSLCGMGISFWDCLRLWKGSSLMMDGGFPTLKRGCRVNQQLGGHHSTVEGNHWIPDGEKRILPLIISRNNTQEFLCCWYFILRLFKKKCHEKKSIMLNHAWSPSAPEPWPWIWTLTQPMRMRGPSGVPAHPSPFQLNHPSGKDWTFRKQRHPFHP